MQRLITFLSVILLATTSSALAEEDSLKASPTDTSGAKSVASPAQNTADRVVVFYLHGNRRCATCKKLEAYSEEAVATGFATQLADSTLVWQVINFEDADNEHYVKDYGLYSQSLVLSRRRGGREIEWKNLDEIWTLVGNRKEFMAYVQAELAAFLTRPEDQDG